MIPECYDMHIHHTVYIMYIYLEFSLSFCFIVPWVNCIRIVRREFNVEGRENCILLFLQSSKWNSTGSTEFPDCYTPVLSFLCVDKQSRILPSASTWLATCHCNIYMQFCYSQLLFLIHFHVRSHISQTLCLQHWQKHCHQFDNWNQKQWY